MTSHIRSCRAVVLSIGFVSALACTGSKKDEPEPAPPVGDGQPAPATPDRLPEGVLLEGTEHAFGLTIPKGMKLVQPSKRSARARGNVHFDDLTDYVKARISARHAEMLDGQLVFPNARIRGNSHNVFEVTISKMPQGAMLQIKDETKPPGTPGLTEEQRWKRAGLRPSGELIDPNGME